MKPIKSRKITVSIPIDLLESALRTCDGNITEAVKQGLKLIAASQAYDRLRSLRGKMKLSIDLESLREDR